MKSNIAIMLGLAALAAAAVGCSHSKTLNIESPDTVLPKEEVSALLDRFSNQDTVDENSAFRAMLMLVDGKDDCETFSQRVMLLKERNIVSPSWDFQADKPITRGKLAYMIYTGCDFSGGLTLTIFGPSQRYCLRELLYKGIVIHSAGRENVGGMEAVAIISRADAYLEAGENEVSIPFNVDGEQ